jgi:2-keto-4-pentenoate hydratase
MPRPELDTLMPRQPKDQAMTDIQSAVLRLRQGRTDHVLHPAPELADEAAAYAVQDGVARSLDWFGGTTPRHWKSGAPSHDDTISHAPLPPAGVWASPATAGTWPFTLRRIEAEVALRLREPVDVVRAAALDLRDARALVDAMCVSIEIVDSRWVEGLQVPALAKLADQLCHGALVLGAWVEFDPVRDWTTQGCRVRIGTQADQVFCGTHSMADPAFVLPA